eukprot:scaffold350_cov133-Cylindrotheca_fusiformis.AAC.14
MRERAWFINKVFVLECRPAVVKETIERRQETKPHLLTMERKMLARKSIKVVRDLRIGDGKKGFDELTPRSMW